MIIKNVKPTTTVEAILKALDPFAYLDERNVRLVKAKPPGAKCFCFVDMDSHEVPKLNMNTHNLLLIYNNNKYYNKYNFIHINSSFHVLSVCHLSLRFPMILFFCSKWHVWLSSSLNPDPSTLMESEFMPRSQDPSRTKSKLLFCKSLLNSRVK